MDSLYWLTESLAGIPLALWIYLGVGIPWALAILPRQDWVHRALVGATAFAVGPAWLTLWMFMLGTLATSQNQPLLRFDLSFIGTLIIAGIGIVLAWRKSKIPTEKKSSIPFAFDEKLILGLIVIAVILRWVVTAFWTFTAYDALWVYGFEGRLYFLTNSIPQDIAYYPQFVPLQYTFLQLAYGSINDHVARMVIPMMHIGSILSSYSLGARLFSRRVGLILAGIWALHPHTGQWAFIGDLEIPTAFLFHALRDVLLDGMDRHTTPLTTTLCPARWNHLRRDDVDKTDGWGICLGSDDTGCYRVIARPIALAGLAPSL